MVPKKHIIQSRRGFSIISLMIAITILLAAIIGTSNFRYYSALDAKKASAKITASRIGLSLCESWRGLGGVETYDPIAYFSSDLKITTSSGPAKPEDFTLMGSYVATLNDANYYITLSWKDVSDGLRALNIIVTWAKREQVTSRINNANETFQLTTYAL